MLRALLLFASGVSFFAAAPLAADTWQLDPPHSSAQFAVRHLGISTVRGAFTKLSGTLQYDPADVTKSVLDVTIDTTSVDTRVEMRDNDLRSDHFLDTARYPKMTFHSTSVEPAGDGHLKVAGDLTLHGVTKPVTLDVEGPSKPIKDPRGRMHMGAAATTTIHRADFGMTNMQGPVGNDVMVTIDVELVQPAAPDQK